MQVIRNSWELVKNTYNEWDVHNAPKLGAALAYYTVLALAPLLIVTIAVIGLVLGPEAARGEIVGQIRGMVGTEGAKAIETVITNANKPATGTIAGILGLITLFIGASGVFTELHDSLNRIWDVKPRESSGVWSLIRDRFLSFGMVLAIGFLLLVSLALSAAIAAAGKYMGGILPVPEPLLQVLNLVVSLGFITVLFTLIFRFLPDEKISWRDVWLGAFVTAALFTLGKLLIGLYLGKASVGSAYGAAGSLVIVLVWVYYSAQIFFFGAEFTHVYAKSFGSLKGRQPAPEANIVTVPVEKLHPGEAEPAPTTVSGAAAAPFRGLSPNQPMPSPAVRAMSLVVIAGLGGLGWWRTRSHRHAADQ